MVAAMLSIVMSLLEVDRNHVEDELEVIDSARRQLRIIALGMSQWRSTP